MAKLSILAGSTSKLLDLFVLDSSSTVGAGLTGLVFNTASLTAYYYREGAASATAISLATMTLGTWATSGFVVIDGTNMPGCYQLGLPNAALAAGAKSVLVMLKGATNMAPVLLEIELTASDNQDSVRFGLTALPNAAAEASGGLYTRGTGAGQINQPANGLVDTNTLRWNGTAVSTPTVAGVPNVNVKTWNDLTTVALPLIPTTAGRTLDVSAGGEAGLDWANVGSPTTTVDLSGTTIKTTQKVDVDTIKTNPVVNAGTVTFPTTATLASTTNITAGTITTATNVTTVNGLAADVITAAAIATDAIGSAELAASAISEIQAGLSTLDAAGVRTALGLASANIDTQLSTIAGYIDTEVAAIKAKTDSLTFTAAGQVDANVQRINDVTITGDGSATPFGV